MGNRDKCMHVIQIFVVVNFDALAQASDIRIERRQVVFLCWRQDSNPEGLRHIFASRLNACWQTDWAIEDQAKTSTRQPVPMISKHSAHLTPLPFGIRTWLWRYTYLLLLILMLWHRQAIFESKGDKLSSSAEGRIRTQRVSDTYSPADWMLADKPTELSRIKLKLELDSPSLTFRMGSRDKCMHVIQILMIVITLCVWACEASLQCLINRRKFHSPQTQLTRWQILPFRLSVGDMICADLCEIFTDPWKRNCFALLWVESTLKFEEHTLGPSL